jgi:hypothetical protein
MQIPGTLPRYSHATALNCWICAKFSVWLEDVDGKIFEDWRRQALQVKYSGASRMSVEETSDNLWPFGIRLHTSGYNRDHDQDEDFIINIDFFSSPGEPW